jgi:excisionase family DNA binding protein
MPHVDGCSSDEQLSLWSKSLGGVVMANVDAAGAKQPDTKTELKISIPVSERPTLTVNEFCMMIGIGRSTFYKAVGAGHLQVRKYGKRTFITQEEMKRFIQNMPSG